MMSWVRDGRQVCPFQVPRAGSPPLSSPCLHSLRHINCLNCGHCLYCCLRALRRLHRLHRGHCFHRSHGLHRGHCPYRFHGLHRGHGLHRFHGLHCLHRRYCLHRGLPATNLSILRPCSANALLAQILFCCVCCLCYSLVTSYPRFSAPRYPTKLLNPNPKHLDYTYDLDANRCDGATQCAE
jgi:hypothetical protein